VVAGRTAAGWDAEVAAIFAEASEILEAATLPSRAWRPAG
jgi:hypothetical protein